MGTLLWCYWNLYWESLLPSRRGGCSKGAFFTSRIHWTKKWICFKFSQTCTKVCELGVKSDCVKVVDAECAKPFTQRCKWVCKLGIYHFCAYFSLTSHFCTWANLKGNPFFHPVIQVHSKGPRNYNIHATVTGGRGCGGGAICHNKVQHSYWGKMGDYS